MSAYIRPLVVVDDGPIFLETFSWFEADLAATVFTVQWRYVHGRATPDELFSYLGIQIAGHTVETDPDVLDEYGRRGDFDLAEVYREMFG